ncbi:MAG: polysaccharide biosynthesis protein [Oscillospiraceae bacterium]|nr:polysaccharide biosynthesis protein [Oscillospiraceae bacterium]
MERNNSGAKKGTFFGGAAILAATTLIVKVIGAVYKIPLGNILTDPAYADFDSAYSVYGVFLTFSTAGLPVALSKLISEALALDRRNQVKRTFRIAFSAFLVLGLFSFFCMSVLAGPLSTYALKNPKAVYCVIALSPSVLCVCIVSAFRGYFQGHFNMAPTGVSQIIEAIFKVVVGLPFAYALLKMNIEDPNVPDLGERLPAVGAIVGVSVGSIVALLYMIFVYLKHRQALPQGRDQTDSNRDILSTLLKLAVPITLTAATSSIVIFIDNAIVMERLQTVFLSQGQLADAALDAARSLKGLYAKCTSIYNLPFAMMSPLAACIIPGVSAALARKNRKEAQKLSESALRIGLLVAMPMGMGIFALGEPIMAFLIRNTDSTVAGPLLSVLGIASIFVAIQLLFNSILQANGIVTLPVVAAILGGITKLVVNYVLVGNPNIMINGAPLGTLACFVLIDILELFVLRRAVRRPPSFLRAAGKPFIASVLMAGSAWGIYGLLAHRFQLGNSISTVLAVFAGVCVYAALVFALQAITAEDLSLMPKGDKIAKILKIQ